MPEAASAPPASGPSPSERRAPRPRQARSVATRTRLLEATVGCLVELGLAGTTTPEVGRRAGVSQGAVFKHFPTKAALLAATVEHLFAELIAGFRAGFAQAGEEEGDPIPRVIAMLWTIFQEPRLLAAYELYVASRTDADLRRALAPVLLRHREALREEARRMFPAAAAREPEFDAAVDVLLNALQGAALGAIPLPDPESERRQLVHLEAVARSMLRGPGA